MIFLWSRWCSFISFYHFSLFCTLLERIWGCVCLHCLCNIHRNFFWHVIWLIKPYFRRSYLSMIQIFFLSFSCLGKSLSCIDFPFCSNRIICDFSSLLIAVWLDLCVIRFHDLISSCNSIRMCSDYPKTFLLLPLPTGDTHSLTLRSFIEFRQVK